MHPLIQAELASLHQEELLQSAHNEQLLSLAGLRGHQRPRWLPSAMHRTLGLLRLRRRSRRLRLAHRRYPTSWQHDLQTLLERD